MGNWTTVNMIGTCDAKDLPALRDHINIGNDWDKFHCLCNTGGLCGLGSWPAENINATGNLAERDYDSEDIAEKLKEIVIEVPSLKLKVHVGGDYESSDCVATVNCVDGKVTIDAAEVKKLSVIPEGQITDNLMAALSHSNQ